MSLPTISQVVAGLKARDPDTLLFFATKHGYIAFGADSDAVTDVLGEFPGLGLEVSDSPPAVLIPADAIEIALANIIAAGLRAAIVERATAVPKGRDVGQTVATKLED